MCLTVMEFGCFFGTLCCGCDDGIVCWDSYKVDKGFGLSMGLHVRSFYKRKGD